ncbi:SH3 domain-containing protein [Glaesserella parasuis]|uniref:SH3 domain-containing protein n=1 Tax=Glaesserella parasuis TaxID=738 RepID=UPI003B0D8610
MNNLQKWLNSPKYQHLKAMTAKVDKMEPIQTFSGKLTAYTLPSQFRKLSRLIELQDFAGNFKGFLLPPDPSLLEIKELIDIRDFSNNLSGFALPPEIEKLHKVLEQFRTRFINLGYSDELLNELKIIQKTIAISTSNYLGDETIEAVIVGDEQKIQQFTLAQIISVILIFFEVLSGISSFTGYTLKDFIESTEKEVICQEYQIENVENAEIRKVRLTKGTLNVRQYPNDKGKVLAELPNGELLCLPNKAKGNQRWLKVQVKDEDDNLVTGYVNARYTEKITIISGQKF